MNIKKAVIPVAGLGTRMLPFTKAVPKELVPVFGYASIHFILKEAVESGIKEVLFVTSEGKEAILEYFKKNRRLEKVLEKSGKDKLLAAVRSVPYDFKKASVIQKAANGLGDAILHAEKFAKNEPFAVFLPDDIIFSKKPAIKQMMEAAKKYKRPMIAVERVGRKMISSYGIIKPGRKSKRTYEVLDVAEKPGLKKAFSNLGIVGRYIMPPEIFGCLKKVKPGAKGEIQLTDALYMLMNTVGLYAYEFEGDRCDTGNTYGYLVAQLKYAARDRHISNNLKKDIKKIFKL